MGAGGRQRAGTKSDGRGAVVDRTGLAVDDLAVLLRLDSERVLGIAVVRLGAGLAADVGRFLAIQDGGPWVEPTETFTDVHVRPPSKDELWGWRQTGSRVVHMDPTRGESKYASAASITLLYTQSFVSSML